ncbi:MAG: hypothetical protein KDI05_11275 [Halieaceae bacterium]|nr:hypothetical protein [Halieaceae bacterium]
MDNLLEEHRELLKRGYKKGLLIASGPREPRTGGIIIARGDIHAVRELMSQDPYSVQEVANYSYISFTAVLSDKGFKQYLQ